MAILATFDNYMVTLKVDLLLVLSQFMFRRHRAVARLLQQ